MTLSMIPVVTVDANRSGIARGTRPGRGTEFLINSGQKQGAHPESGEF